uniref:Pentatricopeptide repeat-containing protein At5g08490 family n=1 Tax=Cajanus cajan TaxID=3821 RepID=A0A151TR05_CAJCA|nr:Putative pentatricopeptide repeat-containing protein At5g08490 family [Cajanus cajan]
MLGRDFKTWGSIICRLCLDARHHEALSLFHHCLKGCEAFKPDHSVLASILKSCSILLAPKLGRALHSYVVKQGHGFCQVTNKGLLNMYAKCGMLDECLKLFDQISHQDPVTWNIVLSGFSWSNKCDADVMRVFRLMHSSGEAMPSSVTIAIVLPVCARLGDLDAGKCVHGYVIKSGFEQDTLGGNALVSMYAKCGLVSRDACAVFDNIVHKDVVSWNAMIAGLAENGVGEMREAESLFWSMDARDLVSWNAVIAGYTSNGEWLKALHLFGSHHDANIIFSGMSETDLTTWNLMVRVYAENDCSEQALGLFHELQAQGMKPDAVTIMSLLPVCTQMASLHLLSQCHGYIIRSCFKDLHLEAALLDAYAKCGVIGRAYKIFQSSMDKDLVMFTAMIGGYAMHGMSEEALWVFSHMLKLGIQPDHIIFTSVLSACSHAGRIDEGLKVFYSIEKLHGMKPTMEQYACMVDLLARGGRISEAYSLVTSLPIEANANLWGSLLGACKIHHEVELGRVVANQLFKIEANDIGNYIVLSNLYAADARWDGVMEVRRTMRNRDLKKPAGCSWIEVERTNNIFVAGDCSHPQRSIIYSTLHTLDQQVKEPVEFLA